MEVADFNSVFSTEFNFILSAGLFRSIAPSLLESPLKDPAGSPLFFTILLFGLFCSSFVFCSFGLVFASVGWTPGGAPIWSVCLCLIDFLCEIRWNRFGSGSEPVTLVTHHSVTAVTRIP
uniref:Uncharacterized protein n=1 Tax=Cacopsylla melanoneura TaxID=428564 RepID=A0A8D8PMZ4_9HEMI